VRTLTVEALIIAILLVSPTIGFVGVVAASPRSETGSFDCNGTDLNHRQ